MTWQPIETAPRDGTRILILRPDGCGESRVDIAAWDRQPFHANPRPFWRWESSSFMDQRTMREYEPTRWMPLPEAHR